MEINIKLTKEEAIVFFEFLSRVNEKEELEMFEDQSEQKVLWNLECILEKELSTPLLSDYKTILKKARASLRDING